jgi:hypothetical protein
MQADESAMEHLRERWRKSPDRRATIALAMSQRPNEANWDYLVRSMGVLDLFAVGDVCGCLLKIEAATEEPEAVRQVILQGCKLVEAGQDPSPVLKLLEYWTATRTTSLLDANPQEPDVTNSDVTESDPQGSDSTETESTSQATRTAEAKLTPMAAWQNWYASKYPDAPSAVLANETADPRWSLDFIEQFLNGEQGRQGSTERGQQMYAKARCNACHKMNGVGGGYGPDLTSVNKRFTRIETLESILFPSHVISDELFTFCVLFTLSNLLFIFTLLFPPLIFIKLFFGRTISCSKKFSPGSISIKALFFSGFIIAVNIYFNLRALSPTKSQPLFLG